MLYAQAELAEHILGDVQRALGHKIDADPLGADQPCDLFDLVLHRLRALVEQQMGLVEETDEARLVGIAHLRQVFVELGQEPQQKGGIDPRRLARQARGVEYVDQAEAGEIGDHDVT